MRNIATEGRGRKHEKNAPAMQMAQADCCRLLAACFYPPDKKVLVEERITTKLKALLKVTCPGAMHLAPPAQKYTRRDGNTALSVAYTRLFLGPPSIMAPPYASFYLDKKGLVMGPSTIGIAELYRTAGLSMDKDFDEMPDHIAVMLEFLYYLLFQESLAEVEGNHEEKIKLVQTKSYFLNNYMCTWIPAFCGRIYEADVHLFYCSLAQCLEMFMQYTFKNDKTID